MTLSNLFVSAVQPSFLKTRCYLSAAMLSVVLLGSNGIAQNSTETDVQVESQIATESTDSASSEIFPVVGVNGEKADLNKYLDDGKWTLVKVWATWCHVCEQQKPVISALHDKHVDGDLLSVVGLVLDGQDETAVIRKNLEEHPATFENLVTNLDDVFAFNYGQLTQESFYGTPTYLLFDPDGEFVANRAGMIQAGDIERSIAKFTVQ